MVLILKTDLLMLHVSLYIPLIHVSDIPRFIDDCSWSTWPLQVARTLCHQSVLSLSSFQQKHNLTLLNNRIPTFIAVTYLTYLNSVPWAVPSEMLNSLQQSNGLQ